MTVEPHAQQPQQPQQPDQTKQPKQTKQTKQARQTKQTNQPKRYKQREEQLDNQRKQARNQVVENESNENYCDEDEVEVIPSNTMGNSLTMYAHVLY